MPQINVDGRQLYWELRGEGDLAVCMGGWGTFCHGAIGGVPRALTQRFQVLVLDYPGLGDSQGYGEKQPSTGDYAEDLAAILTHIGLGSAHLVGMVGLGGCIAQELAIRHPELTRSMVLMGTWGAPDAIFTDQMQLFLDIHQKIGWEAFQLYAAAYSFEPDYYEANRSRLIHPEGPWSDLRGRLRTHEEFIGACLGHNVLDRLGQVTVPSLVIHATQDILTGPRLTEPLARALANVVERSIAASHVVAGRERRAELDRVLTEFFDLLQTPESLSVERSAS